MEDFMGFKADDQEKININESCQCSDEDPTTIKEQDDHDEVESTRSEMAIAREENARLKTLLQRVERDYKALQLRFVSVFQQDHQSKKIELSPITNNISTEEEISADHDDDDREHEVLVSLRLGTSPRTETHKKEESRLRNIVITGRDNPGPDNCSSTPKKENDRASPGKAALKTERSGDEEISQTSVKRARVCVRARCDTPTMNDGGQWRKYGQKIAKGNPCPRAYYRCTVSPTCPVRKQVQRCVEDMSILITTYEGTHNHTVPVSAIAMASTTSAAASMLLSGSSSTTSQPPPTAPPPHNLFAPSPPTFHPYQPYFLPNSSSSSSPFPTITLDLTTANSSTTHGGFGLYSSTSRPNPRVPPPTSLSFSSMDSNMAVPTVWGGGGFSNYGNFPYKNDHRYSQPSPGKPAEEQKYQSYLEKFNQASSQQALTETLTKVITSDASFRSVIAAAISTMATNGKVNNDVKGENLGTNLNWGEHIPAADFDPLT